jgi:hypothetical protein
MEAAGLRAALVAVTVTVPVPANGLPEEGGVVELPPPPQPIMIAIAILVFLDIRSRLPANINLMAMANSVPLYPPSTPSISAFQ